ncbi:hypothetical protein NDI49_11360 [Trichocoleus sp. ST-U3]
MNKLASKDSKEQILEAFKQLIADKKKIESKIATKEQEAEKEKNKKILQAASTYTIDSIVKGLADLQLEFGGIVFGLSAKLTGETSKLDELKRALDIETQHLQELQQIRVVADALHILTQEHQENLKSLEQKIASEREALEKQQSTIRKSWQKEQEEFETTLQEQNALLTTERQREVEEYQYDLERTRKIETDEYEEIKRNLERELQQSEKEKEKQWSERENSLTKRQAEFTEHQKKIEGFPKELEDAVKKAREEAIKDVHQDAKVQADLYEKEWEATKQANEFKIQSLEQTIQKQSEQITEMTAQLQAALKQAQDIAMRAFDNSSAKLTGTEKRN